MAVLRRNPDVLSYLVVQDAYEDENGDYHVGREYWEGEIRCDAVSNQQAKTISTPDGEKYQYAYEVCNLPSDVREFGVGEKVRISLFGGEVEEFTVRGFHRYQKQSKIWV